MLWAAQSGIPVVLDYIHIDTIYAPELAALVILALGGLLAWRKK